MQSAGRVATAAIIISMMIVGGSAVAQDSETVATIDVATSVIPHAQITMTGTIPLSALEGEEWEKYGAASVTTAANFPYSVNVNWISLSKNIQSLLELDLAGQHQAGTATGLLQIYVTLSGTQETTTEDEFVPAAPGEAAAAAEVYYEEDETREDVGTIQVIVTPQE
ncbi:MAG: hypothetical protein ACOX9R_16630 [Armatimonadota bacterium]|jgi:hypothetical protein